MGGVPIFEYVWVTPICKPSRRSSLAPSSTRSSCFIARSQARQDSPCINIHTNGVYTKFQRFAVINEKASLLEIEKIVRNREENVV